MQVVSAPVFFVAAVLAPLLCLAEVSITSPGAVRNLHEHAEVTLECRSTDQHADWKHNGHAVSNTTGRFHVSEEKTLAGGLISRLTIVSAEPEDAGIYECACSHSGSSANINVTVVGHEHHTKVMIDGPTEVEKAPGSQLQLTCKADIHSKVEWFLNGVTLMNSTKDAILLKDEEHSHQRTVVLVRQSLAAEDFGVYSCRNVRDSHDEATVTVKNASLKSSSGRHAMETTGLAIAVVSGAMIVMALLDNN